MFLHPYSHVHMYVSWDHRIRMQRQSHQCSSNWHDRKLKHAQPSERQGRLSPISTLSPPRRAMRRGVHTISVCKLINIFPETAWTLFLRRMSYVYSFSQTRQMRCLAGQPQQSVSLNYIYTHANPPARASHWWQIGNEHLRAFSYIRRTSPIQSTDGLEPQVWDSTSSPSQPSRQIDICKVRLCIS